MGSIKLTKEGLLAAAQSARDWLKNVDQKQANCWSFWCYQGFS